MEAEDAKSSITSSGIPGTQFKVNIYNLYQEGTPDTNILTGTLTGQAASGGSWVDLDVSSYNIVLDSDFLISMEWLTAPNTTDGSYAQFLGVDTTAPNTRSFWKFPDQGWTPIVNIGTAGDRDAMIRTTVEY